MPVADNRLVERLGRVGVPVAEQNLVGQNPIVVEPLEQPGVEVVAHTSSPSNLCLKLRWKWLPIEPEVMSSM